MQTNDFPNNIPDFTTLAEGLFLKIKDQDSLLENKDQQISDLHFLINQMKRKIYGASSEIVNSHQLNFSPRQ